MAKSAKAQNAASSTDILTVRYCLLSCPDGVEMQELRDAAQKLHESITSNWNVGGKVPELGYGDSGLRVFSLLKAMDRMRAVLGPNVGPAPPFQSFSPGNDFIDAGIAYRGVDAVALAIWGIEDFVMHGWPEQPSFDGEPIIPAEAVGDLLRVASTKPKSDTGDHPPLPPFTVDISTCTAKVLNTGKRVQLEDVLTARWLKVLTDRAGTWISSTDLETIDSEIAGLRTERRKVPRELKPFLESKRQKGSRVKMA